MGSHGAPPHALVIPMPQAGHWNPMKILIRQLVSMNVSLTVLSSPKRISELQQWQNDGEFDTVQHVELVEAFTDPIKRFNSSFGMFKQMEGQFYEQTALKENLIAQKAAGCGPTFIIADMFLYWTQDVADQLEIPRYTFFTTPTTFALLILHAPSVVANDYNPRVPHKRDEIVNLPGMEVFRVPDIWVGVCDYPDACKLHSEYLTKAAGIVINSFEYYEAGEATALRSCLEKVVGNGKVPTVHLIGPLQCLPIKPLGRAQKELTAETDDSECLRFLDTQEKASVLFICFGSRTSLEQPSITELARGLELSAVPFLWILPCPAEASSLPFWDVSEILPEGFLTRTKGRGFVCTVWAPQTEILDHSSTGGFISHCGWNSLLETIRAGVAVIPWPVGAEQLMNARFLVEVAKVGIEIQPTEDGRRVGEEIAKSVRLLMNSEEGKETKLKMKELQRSAESACGDGGSSNKALRSFRKDISSFLN